MDVRDVRSFFFEASLHCWAGEEGRKGELITLPQLPGAKIWQYGDEDGLFRYVDAYVASEQSAGQTIIWYNGNPVWIMQYRGAYSREAIPTLKRALRKAYVGRDFFGGRGPYVFSDGDFLYLNRPSGNFGEFQGEEEILETRADGSRERVGIHSYSGRLLSNFM